VGVSVFPRSLLIQNPPLSSSPRGAFKWRKKHDLGWRRWGSERIEKCLCVHFKGDACSLYSIPNRYFFVRACVRSGHSNGGLLCLLRSCNRQRHSRIWEIPREEAEEWEEDCFLVRRNRQREIEEKRSPRWQRIRWARTSRPGLDSSPNGSRSLWIEPRRRWALAIDFLWGYIVTWQLSHRRRSSTICFCQPHPAAVLTYHRCKSERNPPLLETRPLKGSPMWGMSDGFGLSCNTSGPAAHSED